MKIEYYKPIGSSAIRMYKIVNEKVYYCGKRQIDFTREIEWAVSVCEPWVLRRHNNWQRMTDDEVTEMFLDFL